MPRDARKNLISNFVHIMVQGINKEYIFNENFCKEKYLKVIKEKINEYKIHILSYCIMDNHTHLLIHYEDVSELSVFMKRINTTYAKWYNDHKKRVGFVFRDRYKTEQILDSHHLYSCVNYIHNNPVKAKMVDKPEQYRFSSYKIFLSDNYIKNSKILKLLNLSLNDFKEIFIYSKDLGIYKNCEISPKEIIEEFLNKRSIEGIEEIQNNKLKKKLIEELKLKSNIDNIEIAELLCISKATLYRIKK